MSRTIDWNTANMTEKIRSFTAASSTVEVSFDLLIKEHKNLLGFHPELGSICVSLRKEIDSRSKTASSKGITYQYRGILRTFEKFEYVTRTEAEIAAGLKQKIIGKISTKDVLLSLFPQCEPAKLKEVDDTKLSFDLLSIEEKTVERNYKFGVMYCKSGQTTEEEMFSNEHGSEDFNNFLTSIGEWIRLKGFKGFRGGLDVKEDTTGTDSVVSKFREMNVMLHVSTLMPYSVQNRQQIARKAHIGNDIGVIVFKEAGDSQNPFNPTSLVSQFPHYFLVVESVKHHGSDKKLYRIACTRKDDVPCFGPYPSEPGYFELNAQTKDFILAKMINGENASYRSQKFTQLRQRTRKALLEDLTKTHLRKASLGSNSSLATWKSQLFGTTDTLNKVGKDEKDKRRSAMPRMSDAPPPFQEEVSGLPRNRSFSFNKPSSQDLEDKFSDDNSVKTDGDVNKKSVSRSNKPQSPPSDSLRSDAINDAVMKVMSKNTRPVSLALEAGDKNQETLIFALRQLEREKLEEADKVRKLKSENDELKTKLEQKFGDDAKRLLQENEELELKIELKETKVKLQKALAFIESLQNNLQSAVKELHSQ